MTTRRTFTAEELKVILAEHKEWRSSGGTEGTRANLEDANLARAYLAGADLEDAYLAGAYLAGADLAGADLEDAYLARANLEDANLAGADLARAYLADANLARAYLAGAYLAGADLEDAYLADARNVPDGTEKTNPPTPYVRGQVDRKAIAEHYRLRHPEVPVIPDLDAKILEAVTVRGGKLEMSSVHICETTHCRAGWTTTIAGKTGKELEAKYGWQRAASMIYRASTGRVPHFYASNERAMEDIQKCAAEQSS